MPLTRQQIYRRRRVTVFGSLAVLLGVLFYLPMTLLAPLQSATAVVEDHAIPASAPTTFSWPDYGAGAIGAVGWDDPLATNGGDQPRSIASITKVFTALIVLDEKPLAAGEEGPSVTMSALDASYYDRYLAQNGKLVPVRAGWVFTEHELLELTLIESANNYANSLAVWAFGSEEAYLKAAAGWVAEHGLDGTTLADATGIDPGSQSTPGDLLKLAKLALADPVVSEIVGTKTVTLHDVGKIDNTNALLGVDGVTGMKTGTLDEAGACLLFSADYVYGDTTITVVGVLLGGPDHEQLNDDIETLLASAKGGFHEVKLATAGESFAGYSTDWGDSARGLAEKDASVVVWSDTPVTAKITADRVGVSEKGSDIGSVAFSAGTQKVTVPLVLDADIQDPGAWWRLTNPAELIG